MATARILIGDALDDIEVKSLEVPLTTAEISKGIRYLNRLMTAWAEDGLNPGFTVVQDIDDETNIPSWFEGCLVAHLGIILAPSYGMPLDPRRIGTAKLMLEAAEERLVSLPEAFFPSTLPVGRGNQVYNNDYFFSKEDPDNLSTSSHQNLDDDEGVDLSV